MAKATIRGIFQNANSKREQALQRARDCAGLSKPWYLPQKGFDKNQDLPENFQSIGANGTSTISSKLHLQLYPVGLPWFAQNVAASIRLDPDVPAPMLEEAAQRFFLQDLLITALLESSGPSADIERRAAGFRTAKLKAINMFIITGDSLERMNDDYSITVFARPNYVTKRDTEGRVLWHATLESKDYSELTDDQKAKAQLKPEDYAEKEDPCVELYTLCKWNPKDKNWVITQEIEGHEVNRSEEPVSPYICTAFELAPGEDYGRGLVEQNWGDLKTLDECRERLTDWAHLASKAHPILNETSNMKEEDFSKPSGAVLRGRVESGVWADGCFMNTGKLNDLAFVATFADKLEAGLGKRFLSETGSVRDSERTTAFEVSETTLKELEGATGGMYVPIAEMQQIPTFRRAKYMAQRDRLLPVIPDKLKHLLGDVEILTGLAVLTKARQANSLLEWVDIVAKLGPTALERVNVNSVATALARYKNIYEPGLIKSDADMKKEQDAAIAAQAKMEANTAMIDTAAAVTQQQMTAATVPM